MGMADTRTRNWTSTGRSLRYRNRRRRPFAGNTMQFCLHFGEGGEAHVERAYAVLREGAAIHVPLGPCDYSPCMFSLTDRFGVCWCLFV